MGKDNSAKKKDPTKKKPKKVVNMNTNIIVNIENPLDTSYVKLWKTKMGSDRKRCCIAGCMEDIFTCVTVRPKDKRRRDKAYYIPVCYKHFNNKEDLPVKSEAKLAELNPDDDGTGPKKAGKAAGFIKMNSKKDKTGATSNGSPTNKKRTNSNKPDAKKDISGGDTVDKSETFASNEGINYAAINRTDNSNNDDGGCIVA